MRICLVGATHPCHNPRLVREADSLFAAGHSVRVVAPSFVGELRERDQRLMEKRGWQLDVIDFCPGGFTGNYRAYSTRGARRIYEEIFRLTGRNSLIDRAYIPSLDQMVSAACAEPADWFIAHAHRALPVAAEAARRWNARLGFDCEDLLADNGFGSANLAGLIEQNYLQRCSYVSFPSEAVARAFVESRGSVSSFVLYNFFPLSLVNGMAPPKTRSRRNPIRLYWFSQTIGPGRGIEDALKAVSTLGDSFELHLRGRWATNYEEELQKMAAELNVVLHVHPTIDHDDLVQQMDEFDIGLALEPNENRNGALTQSNKIGSYLLAGLAIAASDTPGQREILEQAPHVGFLYPSGKPEKLADGLRSWAVDWRKLQAAQQAAWDVARDRFCWDVEKEKFFSALTAIAR